MNRWRRFWRRLTRRRPIGPRRIPDGTVKSHPSAALARARLEAAVRAGTAPFSIDHVRGGPRGNGRRRSPAPQQCCEEYAIVTACDGVTDTVICGVCRGRFQRPCPDGPIGLHE